MYCSSCGKEVDESASYCPECGYELEQSNVVDNESSQEETESTETTEDTGSGDFAKKSVCQRCGNKIPVIVTRCSYCGYEPSSLSFPEKVIASICLPVSIIGGFLLIIAVSLVTSGEYTLGTFLLAAIMFGSATFLPLIYLNKLRKRLDKKPTDVI